MSEELLIAVGLSAVNLFAISALYYKLGKFDARLQAIESSLVTIKKFKEPKTA